MLINLRGSLVAASLLICLADLCRSAQANRLVTRGTEVGGSKISCDNVRCGYGASCAIGNGKPICKCPSLVCAQIYKPVCGTDGVTYPNSCALKTATCKSNGSTIKAKDGDCAKSNSDELDASPSETGSSRSSDYDKKEHADEDSNGNNNNNDGDTEYDLEGDKPRKNNKFKKGRKLSKYDYEDSSDEDEEDSTKPCKLSSPSSQPDDEQIKTSSDQQQLCSIKPCTMILQPVCGSNGVTYNNICILQNTACKTQTRIFKIKDGPCGSSTPSGGPSNTSNLGFSAKCGFICQRARAPLCSQVQLEQGQTNFCLTPQSIPFVERCQCNFSSTPSLPASPFRRCQKYCPLNYAPICGSNGRTYGNDCDLQRASCQSPIPIFKVHDGKCRSNSFPGGLNQASNTPRDPVGSVADSDYWSEDHFLGQIS